MYIGEKTPDFSNGGGWVTPQKSLNFFKIWGMALLPLSEEASEELDAIPGAKTKIWSIRAGTAGAVGLGLYLILRK